MYSATFWFTLLHETAHINNRNLDITFEDALHHAEDEADIYAENELIPREDYALFISYFVFTK